MLRTMFVLSFLLATLSLWAQTTIDGNLRNINGWSDTIYLLAIDDYDDVFASTNKYVIDTATVDERGAFNFTLAELPCQHCLYRIDVRPEGAKGAYIFGGSSKENFALFELRDGQRVTVEGDAAQFTKSFRLTGEVDNWTYSELRAIRTPVYEVADRVQALFADPTSLEGVDVDSLQEAIMEEMLQAIVMNNELLVAHLDTSTNFYEKVIGVKVYDYDMSLEDDVEVYERVRDQVAEQYADHPFFQQLTQEIYDTRYVLPAGSPAPPLRLAGVDSQLIDLADVGQNLILVDFWASWCAPCRLENRVTVKPLYEQYRDRGFAVYGVSLDNKKDAWLAAIEKDGINWVTVSDLRGLQSPIYELYKISALPTTYLIEKEGLKILAKDIWGEALEAFVKNYYENLQE